MFCPPLVKLESIEEELEKEKIKGVVLLKVYFDFFLFLKSKLVITSETCRTQYVSQPSRVARTSHSISVTNLTLRAHVAQGTTEVKKGPRYMVRQAVTCDHVFDSRFTLSVTDASRILNAGFSAVCCCCCFSSSFFFFF